MLKLRTIGVRDYAVLEGEQHIGRIRFASERTPGIWLWNVNRQLTGGLPFGAHVFGMEGLLRPDGRPS